MYKAYETCNSDIYSLNNYRVVCLSIQKLEKKKTKKLSVKTKQKLIITVFNVICINQIFMITNGVKLGIKIFSASHDSVNATIARAATKQV